LKIKTGWIPTRISVCKHQKGFFKLPVFGRAVKMNDGGKRVQADETDKKKPLHYEGVDESFFENLTKRGSMSHAYLYHKKYK